MVLLVSVLAENWLQVRRSLLRGGRPPVGTQGSHLALPSTVLQGMGGRLLLVDWDQRRVTHHLPLATPASLCWSPDNRRLFVASGRGARLHVLDSATWHAAESITHPGFHDLHTVTRRGERLLVTAAGTDAVFELDLQGRQTRAWWATRHGLDRTASGEHRSVDPSADHRRAAYPSLHRTVHPNGAVALDDGHWRVTSFHRGAVLDVAPDGSWTPWCEGLDHPHRLRPMPAGAVPGASWLISDTLRGRVLALDRSGRAVAELATGLRWVQDACWSPGGLMVLDDLHVAPGTRPASGNCVLQPATGVRCGLPASWRLVSLEVLDPEQAAACRRWPELPAEAAQRWSVDPGA